MDYIPEHKTVAPIHRTDKPPLPNKSNFIDRFTSDDEVKKKKELMIKL